MSVNVQQLTEHGKEALTYSDFAKFFAERQRPVYVQFRKQGLTVCGRVVEAIRGPELDWVNLDSEQGGQWLPIARVRLCSFDGRCLCERFGGVPRARTCHAPNGATPLGNTGITTRGQV